MQSVQLVDPKPPASDSEWPTWVAMVGCYLLWAASLASYQFVGFSAVIPAALATAFHSSLQHEALHGHPTRNPVLNELLVSLAVGLAIPYRRFRDLHLKHHNDDRLTDPYDDPESFYVAGRDWPKLGPVLRFLLCVNSAFWGRMVIGPALAMRAFWGSEIRLARAGDRAVIGAWWRHAVGVVPVVLAVWASGMPFWIYVLFVAWPGMSLIMVRSYIEHRATEVADHRTAVVDASWFWQLLFLGNNFHFVHHRLPRVPWYRLRGIWRANRGRITEANAGYVIPGYGAVAWRWGLRPREPVVHPQGGSNTGSR